MNLKQFIPRMLMLICIPVACAEERENINNPLPILKSFIESMSEGRYDKVYALYDQQTQKVQLGDAIQRLRRMERGGDKNSKMAAELFKRYYDKEAAIVDFNRAKGNLTEPEKILLQIRHVSKPEKLYHDWLVLENARPDTKSLATVDDFKIEINGKEAIARGGGDLIVRMIFENGKWRIRENWNINHKNKEGSK